MNNSKLRVQSALALRKALMQENYAKVDIIIIFTEVNLGPDEHPKHNFQTEHVPRLRYR